MWKITTLFLCLAAGALSDSSQVAQYVVEIRRLALTDFASDSVWLDTLLRRPIQAGGQYSSAKWTLPMSKYTVEIKEKIYE